MGILDQTEAGFLVDEDFLNFTFDGSCEEDEEPDTLMKITGGGSALPSSFESSKPARNISHETRNGLFPDVVEEELEWLLNKDSFPTVESCFGILSDNPELVAINLSPVSVLDNSSSSSSNSRGSINGNGSSIASSCGNFKVFINHHPVGHRSKNKTRKRSNYGEFMCQNVSKDGSSSGRRCLHCQADKTPQWRAGPMGPKTLCNACGVRFKSGRLFPEYRPASSPTFSNLLHSNSHRKVVEMRRKQQSFEGGGIC